MSYQITKPKYCYRYTDRHGLREYKQKDSTSWISTSKKTSDYQKQYYIKTTLKGRLPKGYFNTPEAAIASSIVKFRKQELMFSQKLARARLAIQEIKK